MRSQPDAGLTHDAGSQLDAGVVTLSARLRAAPYCVVAAVVEIDSTNVVAAQISYGSSSALGQTTPRLVIAGEHVRVPLFGLDASTEVFARVTGWSASGLQVESQTVSFTTGPLPAGLPTLQVTTNDAPRVEGDIFVSVFNRTFTANFAMVWNRRGQLRWYRDVGASSTRAIDFEQLPNGHFALFRDGVTGFEEIDPTVGVVRQIADRSASDGTDGHALALAPNGGMAVLGVDTHRADTRGFIDGGSADPLVAHNDLTEVLVDGGVGFRWHSHPEVGLDEVKDFTVYVDALDGGLLLDTLHANSIFRTADDGYLLSFRQTDSIMKVDRATARVAWRLGGTKSDFRFVGDRFNGFSHQHDAQVLDGGNVLLFDNGNARVFPPLARVAEYQLDLTAKTATLVWEYTHNPPLLIPIAGSARRSSDGTTMVAWATSSLITEVDATQHVTFEAKVSDGLFIYRALPVATLYVGTP